MPYTLKDGSTVHDRRLDRIPSADRRTLNYPVSDALSADQQTPINRDWLFPDNTTVLNQEREGACVGAGITHELMCFPVPIPNLDMTFAREKIYWVAQETDPWPGGSYPGATPNYEGTGVLYGVQAAVNLGYYQQYRWATSEKDMALALGYLGPAIIGVDWYEGMFDPDDNGFIHVRGNKMGGHCCLVTGINIDTPTGRTSRISAPGYYTIHNSWGSEWGDNGNCKISRADMKKLLNNNGPCRHQRNAKPLNGQRTSSTENRNQPVALSRPHLPAPPLR
jgi:hypothetical protein